MWISDYFCNLDTSIALIRHLVLDTVYFNPRHLSAFFQFYRTFLISVLTTFIVNPIYRQSAFLPVLVGFVLHDRFRKPYINGYLNTLQLFSSSCLLLVLGCNSLSAPSYMVDVSQIPSVFQVKKIISIVEMVVYASVPLTFPLWKIASLVMKKRAESEEFKERKNE